jgi:lysozyme
MQITREGLDMIKAHEGLRLKAYKCPSGVWTVGYGHTSAAGSPFVKPDMTIDEAEAERILRSDLAKFEAVVKRLVKVSLTNNQYSAIVSFVYNVGETNFAKSSVLKCINAKQFDLVPAKLALWNKGGGKVLKGLVRRRAEEGALFASHDADDSVEPDTNVQPSTGKSAMSSTTNIAAGAVGVAGVTSTVAQVSDNMKSIKDNIGPEVFAYGLAAVVVIGVIWIVMERIKKSKNEGV